MFSAKSLTYDQCEIAKGLEFKLKNVKEWQHSHTISQLSGNVPHCVSREFGGEHMTTWSQVDR